MSKDGIRLLLSNDDGVEAEGLRVLSQALKALGPSLIAAPLQNRSGVGVGITLQDPLPTQELPEDPPGTRRFGIQGTPADAVRHALQHLLPRQPLLVISGINCGANVGFHAFYSGTVGAALESVSKGVSALAFSLAYSDPPHWETAAYYAPLLVQWAIQLEEERLRHGYAPPFCLNINFPARPLSAIQGIRITRHVPGKPRNPESPPLPNLPPYYDDEAIGAGYISVTPLRLDLTDEQRYRDWKQQETTLVMTMEKMKSRVDPS